jgi:hypothetical protein
LQQSLTLITPTEYLLVSMILLNAPRALRRKRDAHLRLLDAAGAQPVLGRLRLSDLVTRPCRPARPRCGCG